MSESEPHYRELTIIPTKYLFSLWMCVYSGMHVLLSGEKSTENYLTCLVLFYYVPYNTL